MQDTRPWTLGVWHRVATLFSTLLVLAPAVAYGQTVTAVWDPSPPSEQVTGYQVCVSTTSMSCNVQLASVSPSSVYYTFAPSAGVLHYIAVRASNSLGTGPYSSEVAFSTPNVTAPATQNSYIGAAITPFTVSVVDPDGSPLHFTHTGLPVGLTLNATTGQISGTPSTAGTYNVTLFVDDELVTVERSFTWNVSMSVSAVSSAPSAGSGNQQTFALRYSDALGVTDIATARIRFTSGSSTNGASACTVSYTRAGGTVAVQNDAGSGWLTPGTLGSGTIQNSQCTINLASSSATTSGNTLTLNLAVTFSTGFAGAKNIYMLATSNGGASTGWQSRGSWTVTAPSGVPSAVSVTPGSGSGVSGTFALLYSDTVGAADLSSGKVRFVPTSVGGPGTAANGCNIAYEQTGNTVSLSNNAGTSTTVGTLGSGTLSNSQCSVNLASSSVSQSGNNMTVTLAVSFTASFQGDKNVYMRASNDAGTNSDWVARGTWTVPASGGPGVPSAVSVTPGSGTGASGTFVLLYSDTAGVADLSSAKVRFAPTSAGGPGNGINTCTASYDPAGNSLSLMNDSGSAWVAGPLGSGSVSNSQCTIDLASSSVSSSGNNLTLTLAIRFTPAFAGDKNTYLRATTDGGANTDWQARGTWTVPAGVAGTPSVVSVSPNSGGGRSANFVLRYSDTAGATDLATARVRFVNYNVGGAGTGANSCTASYNRSAGTVSLQNNTATGWITGTLGSGAISNSQCTINLAMSTASASGNNLTLTLAITFTQSFNGAKRTYMLGNTNGGTSTGWIQRGVWMVQN